MNSHCTLVMTASKYTSAFYNFTQNLFSVIFIGKVKEIRYIHIDLCGRTSRILKNSLFERNMIIGKFEKSLL